MDTDGSSSEQPAAWREAFRREARERKPLLADPLPERRVARLLAAFILAGLVFMVLPGTLLGVWNLIRISSAQEAGSISRAWIQAHGHAQLFGWVGTFMIGISLYGVPKFRGGAIRSLAVGWAMFALWSGAILARWAAGVWSFHVRPVFLCAASAELLVAGLLIWQCTARGRSRGATGFWNYLVFSGFGGLAVTLAWQLFVVLREPAPVIPDPQNRLLLYLATWAFTFPVAWGFSTRFLPAFLGLQRTDERAGSLGLALLAAGALAALAGRMPWSAGFTLAAVGLACRSLRVFEHAQRPAKTIGVDPRYPYFVRAAFGWLVISAALALAPGSPGLTGASRHAFTVGFLALLIFSLGPRILPAFLNSRELWSKRQMLAAMALLTAGCLLRVVSEPLAYAEILPFAWNVLPVSALIELTAVLVFAWNIGRTLATPVPAWIVPETINDSLTLYWCVSAYPETRRLFERAGLRTLARAREIPWSLTLREAAQADGIDVRPLVELLKQYFDRRLARALREKARG